LKAFHWWTASLSDISARDLLGVQKGANVINISFDITNASTELQESLDYTSRAA